nr:MAG TPA: hypothetical protein [Caudoviricetes sp.]
MLKNPYHTGFFYALMITLYAWICSWSLMFSALSCR